MKKIKVLIADDSEKLLSGLRIHLEANGLEVATCADAYMALAQAQKFKPDVMVLDIRMPAGDGFSVMERMGKIPEVRHIPIIYITGDQSATLDLKAEQLGACGLLHKPIVLSALLKMIDSAATGGHRRSSGQRDIDHGELFRIASEPDVSEIPGVK